MIVNFLYGVVAAVGSGIDEFVVNPCSLDLTELDILI